MTSFKDALYTGRFESLDFRIETSVPIAHATLLQTRMSDFLAFAKKSDVVVSSQF